MRYFCEDFPSLLYVQVLVRRQRNFVTHCAQRMNHLLKKWPASQLFAGAQSFFFFCAIDSVGGLGKAVMPFSEVFLNV